METIDFEESDYIFDNYEHPNPNVFYSVTRTPGKDTLEASFQYLQTGCRCQNSQCTEENQCSCLKYGANYVLSDERHILVNEKFGSSPIFECNFQCSCFNSLKEIQKSFGISGRKIKGLCPNRNVQYGPIDCLEIFDTSTKGLGLRTKRNIPAGFFICEYAGEVIELEEAKERQKMSAFNNEMNFVFVLKEYVGDDLSCVTCVDPTYVGNIGRYINHSCQPNCAIVPVRVNDSVPWLCVFSLRDIEKEEEICYDYSGHRTDSFLCKDENPRKPCFCGSVNCKKFLPFETNL